MKYTRNWSLVITVTREDSSVKDCFWRGFEFLVGEPNTIWKPLLTKPLMTVIYPRTCGARGQGSAEWFLDHTFSFTSTTLQTCFKLHLSKVALIDGHINFCDNTNITKRLCGHPISQTPTSPAAMSNSTAAVPAVDPEVNNWLSSLTSPSLGRGVDKEFHAVLDKNHLSLDKMQSMLVLLGKSTAQ